MSARTPEQLKKLKVADLKEELKRRSLDIKGKKADLVKRLLDADVAEATQKEKEDDVVEDVREDTQPEEACKKDDAPTEEKSKEEEKTSDSEAMEVEESVMDSLNADGDEDLLADEEDDTNDSETPHKKEPLPPAVSTCKTTDTEVPDNKAPPKKVISLKKANSRSGVDAEARAREAARAALLSPKSSDGKRPLSISKSSQAGGEAKPKKMIKLSGGGSTSKIRTIPAMTSTPNNTPKNSDDRKGMTNDKVTQKMFVGSFKAAAAALNQITSPRNATQRPTPSPKNSSKKESIGKAPPVAKKKESLPPTQTKKEEKIEFPAPPPYGKVTRTIRVDGFVRPFTLKAAREYIALSNTDNPCSLEEGGFWMDAIKSHCYATFNTTSDAERARSALYGKVWPAKCGKKLTVEYSEETAKQISDQTNQERLGRRSSGRSAPPSLMKGGMPSSFAARHLNAPVAERDERQLDSRMSSLPASMLKRLGPPQQDKRDRTAEESPSTISAQRHLASDKFQKTERTFPAIYWQPVQNEEATRRKAKLDEKRQRRKAQNRNEGDCKDGGEKIEGGKGLRETTSVLAVGETLDQAEPVAKAQEEAVNEE